MLTHVCVNRIQTHVLLTTSLSVYVYLGIIKKHTYREKEREEGGKRKEGTEKTAFAEDDRPAQWPEDEGREQIPLSVFEF